MMRTAVGTAALLPTMSYIHARSVARGADAWREGHMTDDSFDDLPIIHLAMS